MKYFYLICFILASGSVYKGWCWKGSFPSFGNCQINDAHDVDTCPLSCVKDMLENIATHFPTDDSEDVERLFLNPQSMLNISKQKFQILCQTVAEPLISCMNECPPSSSDFTKYLNTVLGLVKFLCVDHFTGVNFYYFDNYDCLKETNNIFEDQCRNRKCYHLTYLVASIEQMGTLIKNKRHEDLKNLLDESCEYLLYAMPCIYDIITNKCGANIANLITNQFYQVIMLSIKRMVLFINCQSLWPTHCDKLLPSDFVDKTYD